MADGTHISFASRQRRQLPLILQAEAAECALACLAMVARYHGHDVDLPSLRRRFSTSLKGLNLAQVIDIAHSLGFQARPLRAELAYLPEAQMPCILHWDMNHFVVLRRVSREDADIYDPARGRYSIPLSEASKRFTGIVLELEPGTDFSPISARQHISLRALTGKIAGLGSVIIQIFGLALAVEVLALVLPFQIQWVVDQVLLSADRSLLLLMTLGFLIVTAIQMGLTLARAWIISWLGATLSAQWTINLFSHLLKLPLDYFEKRHMGDVLSRFSSIQAIQNTLTGSFVEVVLDGLMGTLALIILFLYSTPLTLWILAALGLYIFLRWAVYLKLWRVNEEQLVYSAKQQTELMESVRGVQAIKLANKQSERRARMANVTFETAQRVMRFQRITLTLSALNQGLFGLQRVVLIALGAYLAIAGKFSAGMLIAFVAYADQFSRKSGNLIDRFVDLRMLRLHAERIADIALCEHEPNTQGIYSGNDPGSSIMLKNLGFRYANNEPWVFRHLNITIEEGESVALVGRSGCGKSTIAKLMLGLLTPQEGHIEIGGMTISALGQARYRAMFSAVMQDDQLFSGSIADNITFFDSLATLQNIREASEAAAIHEEIIAMPMGYETLVGDMGSALSGGQKQRILLARAFYRKPKILILDEATSHLDSLNESCINDTIQKMRITRIIIAHRQETIAQADRAINLLDCLPPNI